MRPGTPPLRPARLDEADAIEALMKASIRELFPHFYDERETASSIVYVGEVDRMLIADGTYYVAEVEGEIVACGGWSRRDRLYTGSGHGADDARLLDPASEGARIRAMFVRADWTRRGLGRAMLDACQSAARSEGFTRLQLLATLPGEQLYRAFGFEPTGGNEMVRLPDGVLVECVPMARPVDPVDDPAP